MTIKMTPVLQELLNEVRNLRTNVNPPKTEIHELLDLTQRTQDSSKKALEQANSLIKNLEEKIFSLENTITSLGEQLKKSEESNEFLIKKNDDANELIEFLTTENMVLSEKPSPVSHSDNRSQIELITSFLSRHKFASFTTLLSLSAITAHIFLKNL